MGNKLFYTKIRDNGKGSYRVTVPQEIIEILKLKNNTIVECTIGVMDNEA